MDGNVQLRLNVDTFLKEGRDIIRKWIQITILLIFLDFFKNQISTAFQHFVTLIGGTTLLTDRAISLSLYLSFSLSRSVSLALPLRSGSSGSSTRSADSVGVDVIRQPSRSRIRRHTNRLSAVFQRGSAQNATAMALPGLPGLPSHAWKESNDRSMPFSNQNGIFININPNLDNDK